MIDPSHGETLAEMAIALPDRTIVLIGAVALAWHFGASFRGTLDLDLCVAIDLEEHTKAAGIPAHWQRDLQLPHRWRLPDKKIVDILPAADALLAVGHLTWPNGTRLELLGIDLAMSDTHRCSEDLPETIRIASRRALFVTKVVSWLDRPGDRFKDLGDLGILLDRYVDDGDLRLFDDPELTPEREFDERAAFLLGKDLRSVCSPRHAQCVREFASRVGDSARKEHFWMVRAAPTSWRRDESALPRRLAALLSGLAVPRS